MFKSDIEIARKANAISIQKVGSKLGLEEEHLLPYGNDKAKISEKFIKFSLPVVKIASLSPSILSD